MAHLSDASPMPRVLSRSSLLPFPLGDAAVNRYEMERRQDGFIAQRTCASANPCVMIYQADGSKVLLGGCGTGAAWLHSVPPSAEASFLNVALEKAVYVGEDMTQPRNVFAVTAADVDGGYLEGREWVSPLVLLGLLGPTEQALLSLALSLKQWTLLNSYCTRCGAAMRDSDYGLTRSCTACRRRIHPTVTPAMIVAVLDGKGNVIMSQRHRHAVDDRGRPFRTVLSGFVAQGESMEETVVREVREETGAEVTRLRYVGSQPWPTPYELMTCYYAVAENSPSITAQADELISVHWVPKEEVRLALAGQHPDFAVVPDFTAAHVLLARWAHGEVDDWGQPARTA